MKRHLMALTGLLLTLAPAQADHNWLVLAEDAAGLWGQADGTGCGNDLVKAAFEAAGHPARLEVAPYARAKQDVFDQKALACFGMAWAEEFRGKILFAAEPLYTTTSTLFMARDKAGIWKSLTDLPRGLTVGVVVGYEYPELFTRLVKTGVLVPVEGKTEIQNLKRLAAGRLDLVLCQLDDLKNADYLLHEAGAEKTVVPGVELASSGTYLGFAADHPQTAKALAAFNAGFAALKKSGIFSAILQKWKTLAQKKVS